ncbi:chorismate-binding protein [Specibacter sp. NPDC057265]|uniref:chorismate-binding protein n=1 Tax=Specibacter sp. NPDC057265 TaxID=3346075 RepID=UPI0036388CE9
MPVARQRPVLIAIDGRSGAGKTTLAVELAALLRTHRPVSLFHLEDVYPGWDGLAGGVERYIETVLAPLSQGRPATWTQWDWAGQHDGAARTTAVAPVVVLEGVGSSHGRAAEFLDAVIWVDAPSQARRQRALERDGEMYAPFWELWAGQEEQLLAGSGLPTFADIVVDATAGVANAPGPVLDALTQLPALEHLLAPELARRRGLEFSALRINAAPPAAELFQALYGASENAVWLDSSLAEVSGVDSWGDAAADRSRFSIMADPAGCFGQIAQHTRGLTTVTAGDVTTRIRGPFFRWLDSVWGRRAVRAPQHYPGDFTLGWLGWLGYGLKAETGGDSDRQDWHRAENSTPRAGTLADAALIFAGQAVVLDHQENCLYALTLTDAHHPGTIAEATAFEQAVRSAAEGVHAAGPITEQRPFRAPEFTVRDGERRYKEMIAAAQAQIHDGNSYEVCLTTALEAHSSHRIDPWHSYRALRVDNPAPFAAFVRFGSTSVASTSPERFLRIDAAGLMRAEPIKGTRRRDGDPAVDAALKADLAGSLKDRAENIMIVDLLRNDLSRFALAHTLQVPRLCAIESYATVHQLVSTIEAQLAPGSSRAQAVAAAFPAGSMTGAPKISTMAILTALESGPRGIYSGAIGYFSLNAATDLSVVIRTLLCQDTPDGGTDLSLGIGGAITADSNDEAEWQEIQAKAHGVLSTLGADFPG